MTGGMASPGIPRHNFLERLPRDLSNPLGRVPKVKGAEFHGEVHLPTFLCPGETVTSQRVFTNLFALGAVYHLGYPSFCSRIEYVVIF